MERWWWWWVHQRCAGRDRRQRLKRNGRRRGGSGGYRLLAQQAHLCQRCAAAHTLALACGSPASTLRVPAVLVAVLVQHGTQVVALAQNGIAIEAAPRAFAQRLNVLARALSMALA